VGADRAQGRRYFGNDNTEMYCTREGGGRTHGTGQIIIDTPPSESISPLYSRYAQVDFRIDYSSGMTTD